MSTHWTTATMIALMLAGGASSIAQQQAPPPAQAADPGMAAKVADRQTEIMKGDLDLTAEQVGRVGSINQTEMSGLQQILSRYKSDPSLDRRDLLRDFLAASQSRDEQLQQVLTPQQWRTWQSAKHERTSEMVTRIMTVQLGLTSQQIARVDEINRTAAKAMRAEMGDRFEEKSPRDKARIARVLRALGEERDKGMVRVLTTEQWTAYQKNKEEMREVMKEKLAERAP